MATTVQILRIGNSRGIRIPKTILEECKLNGTVTLEVRKGRLVVRPVKKARAGWAAAFKRMAERRDDKFLDPGLATDWDKTEWKW